MCASSWVELVNHCLIEPPIWLNLWAIIGPYLRVVLLALSGVAIFRMLQLFFQDEIDYLSPGWIRGKVARDSWTRIWYDYRWWTFLVFMIGSGVVAYGLFHLRSPMNLIKDMGAQGDTWKLTPEGVERMLFYAKLALVSTFLWVIIGGVSLFVLYVDPYGYHKFTLIPHIRSVVWLESVDGAGKPNQNWGPGESKTIRAGKIYFAPNGEKAGLEIPPSETDWIEVAFEPGKGLRGKATLKGQGEQESSKRFTSKTSKIKQKAVTVFAGEEFYIGEAKKNHFRFN